ncbi:MAG: hypothetical protein U0800_27410, partial [Isosphaeraceae bacterium]
PKTLGITHIVYALLLAFVGLVWAVYFLGIPMLLDFAGQKAAESVESRMARERDQLAQLDQQIASMAEGKEKDDLVQQRLELQVNQEIPLEPPRFPMFGMSSPRVAGTVGFEVFTGLFLYFLMIIAGIGLFRLRRWGRSMAIVVAMFKLAQVLGVGVLLAFSAAPALEEGVRVQMTTWLREEAERTAGESAGEEPAPAPAMTPEQMGESIRRLLLIHALGTVVFGSIYPIVTLAVLNQRSVRAVFEGNRKGIAQAEIA